MEASIVDDNFLFNEAVNSVNTIKSTSIKKRIRRKRNRGKMNQTKALSFLSCNAASIQNKLLSLEKIVNDLNLRFLQSKKPMPRKKD